MLFLIVSDYLEISPLTLEIILQKVSLPDLLHFSQTCHDARFLKPQIFELDLKLKFDKETRILFVNNINKIFWKDRHVWEKYRHYFPFDGHANGSDYYSGTKDPNLFDLIEAAKNDNVEFIQKSNYEENYDFESRDMEYFFYICYNEELGSEWRKIDWWPNSIWDIFWWFGGPNVRKFIIEN